jgi:zinc protease
MKEYLFLIALFLFSCAGVQKVTVPLDHKSVDVKSGSGQILPVDSAVIVGKLDNGLTYYIRHNTKPEKRLELRLVVNAGSILENDDEQGLAHFVEHMAFNGTRNFQKQELVKYLESIGMRFGPEVNAYTSFDETIYMLQVPTDSIATISKALLVLSDWARGISFDHAEIDKERGVVIEEWRLGRGANSRVFDKQLPIILKGSKYAVRLPIGKKDILESFPYESPKRFYDTWYRPDLMAVIAVGDIDVNQFKDLLIGYLKPVETSRPEQKRDYASVPGHRETLFAIAADSELTNSRVGIYNILPIQKFTTLNDYRRVIIENLYVEMFNSRLNELTRQKDPPFIIAVTAKGQFIRSTEMYIQQALAKENGIPRALETLLTEVKRVHEFGFTTSELDRTKKSLLKRFMPKKKKHCLTILRPNMFGHSCMPNRFPEYLSNINSTRNFYPALHCRKLTIWQRSGAAVKTVSSL